MAEILVPPGGHTALSDPASVFLELVDESRHRKGMTEAEAYAFLAGADPSSSTLPPIAVAASDSWRDQPRVPAGSDKGGEWTEDGGKTSPEEIFTPTPPDDYQKDYDDVPLGIYTITQTSEKVGDSKHSGKRVYRAWKNFAQGYREINDRLRRGEPVGDFAEDLEVIQDTFGESRLTRDYVTYRGVQSPENKFSWWTDGNLSGTEWVDPAFSYSSTNHQWAQMHGAGKSAVLMRIKLMKGAPAVAGNAVETELISPPGSHYRITKDHGNSGPHGQRVLDVELVQDDSPLIAAAEVHTGAMVALVPSPADRRRLAVDGGEPIGQLHTTLVYLGEAAEISGDVREAIVARLRSLVVDAPLARFAAEGFSINVFNPPGHVKADGKDRDTCIVLGVGGTEIDRLHTLVTNAVSRIDGLKLPEQHKPWVPHITLTYTDDVTQIRELTDRVGPVNYTRLRIAFAGDVVDVPLVS